MGQPYYKGGERTKSALGKDQNDFLLRGEWRLSARVTAEKGNNLYQVVEEAQKTHFKRRISGNGTSKLVFRKGRVAMTIV